VRPVGHDVVADGAVVVMPTRRQFEVAPGTTRV
jgi:hypothetical protein